MVYPGLAGQGLKSCSLCVVWYAKFVTFCFQCKTILEPYFYSGLSAKLKESTESAYLLLSGILLHSHIPDDRNELKYEAVPALIVWTLFALLRL